MKRRLLFLSGLFAAALWGGARRLYHARSRERRPGQESLDDPAVAAAFNRVAGWPQMRLLRWYMVRRALALAQHGHVVDVGCGPGHLVLALARQARNMHLTGIDLSDEVLVQAREYAVQQGFGERVHFEKGHAERIPFPDGSLDMVVSTLSLHHWSRPVVVLDEIARVLRPGGAFLIFDLRRDMATPFYMLIWFATHFVVPEALRRIKEPLGSRNAAYTPPEAGQLVAQSRLAGARVLGGPLWLAIEGKTAHETGEAGQRGDRQQ